LVYSNHFQSFDVEALGKFCFSDEIGPAANSAKQKEPF
jgi:hypothetical protein